MSPLHRPRKRTALGGMALLLALTGSAVALGTTVGSSPASAEEGLPAFDDCDALTSRMQELTLPYVGEYGFNGGGDDVARRGRHRARRSSHSRPRSTGSPTARRRAWTQPPPQPPPQPIPPRAPPRPRR